MKTYIPGVVPLIILLVFGACIIPTPEPVPRSSPPDIKPAPLPAPEPELQENEFIWYVCYGSNLCEERFLCYIEGGQYDMGGSYTKGCDDKNVPQENKLFELRHRLYFARKSSGWEYGGVAFIEVDEEKVPEEWTLARMWKITEEQFEQVRQQEGASWYNHIIELGKDDEGIPIVTITNSVKQTVNPPSDSYVSTIVTGLIESYELDADEVYTYLHRKEGIQSYFPEKELKNIIDQCFNAGE